MLPYILLGDNNLTDNVCFEQELEKQVAYAAVKTVAKKKTAAKKTAKKKEAR